MTEFKDKLGKVINLQEFGKLFEDKEYRRVGSTRLWNGDWVSTVWLGINHGFGTGPELWFETMVFDFKRNEKYQTRYTTLHQSEQGHELVVKQFTPWYQRFCTNLGDKILARRCIK